MLRMKESVLRLGKDTTALVFQLSNCPQILTLSVYDNYVIGLSSVVYIFYNNICFIL